MTGKRGVVGEKIQITLPAQSVEQLRQMANETGFTSSMVIAIALREMYQREHPQNAETKHE